MAPVGPFDPFAPGLLAAPHAAWARLQREDPVHWCAARDLWIVSRHGDAAALLADPRAGHWRAPAPDGGGGELERIIGRWLALMDPARRGRLRAVTGRLFAPARVAALAAEIEAEARRLLDAGEAAGELDVVGGYADPLTLGVVAAQLGVPADERPRFVRLAGRLRGSLFGLMLGRGLAGGAADAAAELSALLLALLERKRQAPGDDLLSALFGAEGEDGLAREDFVALAFVFLFAGHENTTNFLGTAAATLVAHPDACRRLVAAPEGAGLAVEELLRFESPVQMVSLTVGEAIELGGRRLAAGQQVLVAIGAANRDPRVFAEPDRLDLGRTPNPHLALGHGPFFCLGAGLARLEAAIALRLLAERFVAGGWPLLAEPELAWRAAPPVLRGLVSLRLRLGRAAVGAAPACREIERGALA